jgi:hypothetical protein
MVKRLGLMFFLACGILVLLTGLGWAVNRVYFQETGDTIYISSFPGSVGLHMKFDYDGPDSLAAMVHPFTWAGSSAGVSLISKSCDNSGWFAGSAAAIFDQKTCRFDTPDKQMVNGLRFTEPTAVVTPGTNKLYAVWSFNITTENSVLCLDSTFMTPTSRLKWINTKGTGVFPQYTKKCWVIAKSPLKCGDANGDDVVDIADIVFLLNYVFYSGAPPRGLADVNGDGVVDISDIVWLINFIFYAGPAPHC